MDLQVLRAGKHLSTAGKGTGEGLFTGVHPDVVHQLVLCLEGPAHPGATLPEAGVVRDLWPSHVLHCDVRHYLVHARERLAALLLGHWVRLNPLASDLLLDGLAHVAEESTVGVGHLVHVGAGRVVHVVTGHVRLARPGHTWVVQG